MMNHPADLKYANTHEWVKIENDQLITGITDHAQNALGDLVYIEPPKLGSHISVGTPVGIVESVKTASDIHAPLSGIVIAVNSALEDDPDLINSAPYDAGWIYKIQPDNINDASNLLSKEEYEAGL